MRERMAHRRLDPEYRRVEAEKALARYYANRERILARQAAHREANPEAYRVRKKAFRQSHRAQAMQHDRRYRMTHRVEIAKRARVRYRNSPQHRLRRILRERMRRYLVSGAATRAHIGCSWAELVAWLEAKFSGEMSWRNHGALWHVDHVRPLASFDLTREEDVRAACHYANLTPLLAVDNLKKGATWPTCVSR